MGEPISLAAKRWRLAWEAYDCAYRHEMELMRKHHEYARSLGASLSCSQEKRLEEIWNERVTAEHATANQLSELIEAQMVAEATGIKTR